MAKRLYRSRKDKVIAGVCGGIGEYFDIDSTLVRLVWILFIFMGGTGFLAYIIAMIIIPENPDQKATKMKGNKPKEDFQEERGDFQDERNFQDERVGALIGGLILVGISMFFLMSNFGFLSWLNWSLFWPAMLVLLGIVMIVSGSVGRW
jgi:phage shock protein C